MQAFHPGTGMTLEFPDNTPAEEIDRHFMNAQSNMPTTAPSVAQQFIDGARGAYEQQQLSPAPVNGAGFVGLDPQQAQFMLQQRQNAAALQQRAASDNAQNRLQQQKLEQDELEGEKNRATTISLATQRMKNDIAIDKAQAAAAAHAEKMKELGRQTDNQHDLTLEQIRQKGREKLQQQRTEGQKEVAGIRAAASGAGGPKGSDFDILDIYDATTETTNKYSVNKITGERTLIGPAPPAVSKKEGSSGYRHPTVSDSIKIREAIDGEFLKAKSVAETKARAESGDPNAPVQIDEPALREEVARKVRRELGVSAFPDKESARQYMDMQAEQIYNQAIATLPPGALTPETAKRLQAQATNMAQVERWKADGYVAYLDPETGEAIVETDDGKEPGT